MSYNENIKTILSFIFCLISISLFSQKTHLNFRLIGEKEGITDPSFNSFVSQDSRGFIWISTYHDFYRFDGKDAITYDIKTTEVTDDIVQSIFFEDKRNDLWFTTFRGLHKFNRQQNIIESQLLELDGNSFSSDYHAFYLEKKNNKLWLCANGVLLNYNILTNNLIRISDSLTLGKRFTIDSLPSGEINKIYSFPWSNKEGFEIWEKIDDKWSKKIVQNDIFSQVKISHGIIENDSTLWLISRKGLIEFNLKSESFIALHRPFINQDLSLHDGEFLEKNKLILSSAEGSGLWEFDTSSKEFTQNWLANSNVKTSLTSNSPNELFKDSEQNLWVTQLNKGLDVSYNSFLPFFNPLENQESFLLIRSILEDHKNRIWVLTKEKGLFVFSLEKKLMFHFPKVGNASTFRGAQLSIDKNGIIWLSNNNQIFQFLESDTLRKGQWKKIFEIDIKERFKSIYTGLSSRFFFISTEGVWEAKKKGRKFQIQKSNFFSQFEEFGFLEFYKIDSNTFYAPYQSDSILVFRNQQDEILCVDTLVLNSLTNDVLRSKNGKKVWIATAAGLHEFNVEKKIAGKLKREVQTSSISSLVEDHSGLLWAATRNGLITLDLKNDSTIIYTTSNGIVSNIFSAGVSLLASDSTIWLGSDKGLSVFSPKDISLPKNLSTTYIDQFKINNEIVTDYGNINELKSISLEDFENTLAFNIKTINFTNPDNITIEYRLVNYDNDWIEIKRGETARFPQIPPGEYIFETRTKDINKQKGKIKSLIINLPPPFWKTWWFKSLSVLVGILLTGLLFQLYFRNRLREQKRLLEKQKAINEERDRIAKELHDDMGGGLSSILFIGEDMLFEEKDQEKVEQVERISQLAQNALTNMRDIIWALDNDQNTLKDLLLKISSSSSEFLNDYSIDLNYSYDVLQNEIIFGSEKKRNILLIIKECLHNVIKHSKASEVNLNIKEENAKLLITIQDNGIGFDMANNQFTGYGLNNLIDRSNKIEGDLTINSSTDNGTEILLSIPL